MQGVEFGVPYERRKNQAARGATECEGGGSLRRLRCYSGSAPDPRVRGRSGQARSRAACTPHLRVPPARGVRRQEGDGGRRLRCYVSRRAPPGFLLTTRGRESDNIWMRDVTCLSWAAVGNVPHSPARAPRDVSRQPSREGHGRRRCSRSVIRNHPR